MTNCCAVVASSVKFSRSDSDGAWRDYREEAGADGRRSEAAGRTAEKDGPEGDRADRAQRTGFEYQRQDAADPRSAARDVDPRILRAARHQRRHVLQNEARRLGAGHDEGRLAHADLPRSRRRLETQKRSRRRNRRLTRTAPRRCPSPSTSERKSKGGKAKPRQLSLTRLQPG